MPPHPELLRALVTRSNVSGPVPLRLHLADSCSSAGAETAAPDTTCSSCQRSRELERSPARSGRRRPPATPLAPRATGASWTRSRRRRGGGGAVEREPVPAAGRAQAGLVGRGVPTLRLGTSAAWRTSSPAGRGVHRSAAQPGRAARVRKKIGGGSCSTGRRMREDVHRARHGRRDRRALHGCRADDVLNM